MKIIISQKEKNPPHPSLIREGVKDSSPDKGRLGGVLIEIKFQDKNLEKSFVISKSEEFLNIVDKLVKKNRMELKAFTNAVLEFKDVGLLTERTIRVIMQGLSFS